MSGNACDGWQPIHLRSATAQYLAHNDLVAATDILGHNEHGETIGCGNFKR